MIKAIRKLLRELEKARDMIGVMLHSPIMAQPEDMLDRAVIWLQAASVEALERVLVKTAGEGNNKVPLSVFMLSWWLSPLFRVVPRGPCLAFLLGRSLRLLVLRLRLLKKRTELEKRCLAPDGRRCAVLSTQRQMTIIVFCLAESLVVARWIWQANVPSTARAYRVARPMQSRLQITTRAISSVQVTPCMLADALLCWTSWSAIML